MKFSREKSLNLLIKALAYDYDRRDGLLKSGEVSRRVRMEFIYLNSRILEAAESIVGEPFAMKYIKEIGSSIGYAKIEIDCIGEVGYKRNKSEIVTMIGRKLYLTE